MRIRKILLWIALIPIAAVASLYLALAVEGMTNQWGLGNVTPGEIIAQQIVHETGFAGLARSMDVELEIDAPVFFVMILGTMILIARKQRKVSA